MQTPPASHSSAEPQHRIEDMEETNSSFGISENHSFSAKVTAGVTLEDIVGMVNSLPDWCARPVHGDRDSIFFAIEGASVERALQISEQMRKGAEGLIGHSLSNPDFERTYSVKSCNRSVISLSQIKK